MRRKKFISKKLNTLKLLIIFLILIIIFILSSFKLKIESDYKINFNYISLGYYFLFRKKIAEKIMEENPNVIKVNFKLDFLNLNLKIDTEKEDPIAYICSSKCYFLGKHSYIYKARDNQRLIKIISYREIYPETYLDQRLTKAISSVFEFSNLQTLPLKEVIILTNYDIKFKTKNFIFIVDPNKNIEEQLKKLLYFLNNYKKSNYFEIDLRFPKKIYFK